MWLKIKLAIAAAGALAIAVLTALWQRESKLRAQDELGDEQAARAVEAKSHKAMIDGLQKEDKIREEDDSDIKPGHFS
ncbi:MAG: hypothetical protein WBC75_09405 [Dehalococcoidales bacterium]